MIALTDNQLREIQLAAAMVPYDLRSVFLEGVMTELRSKIIGDGTVHRVAYEVARSITWDAERTAAVG